MLATRTCMAKVQCNEHWLEKIIEPTVQISAPILLPGAQLNAKEKIMGSRTKIVRVRNRIFLQAFSYRWLSESGWCRPGGGAYRAAAACCGGPPGTPPGPPGPPAPGGGPAPGSDRTSGRADMPAAGPSGSARGRASSGSSPKILGFESGRLPVVTGCVWSSGPLSGRAKFRRVLPSGSLFFFAFRFLVSSFSVPERAPPPPQTGSLPLSPSSFPGRNLLLRRRPRGTHTRPPYTPPFAHQQTVRRRREGTARAPSPAQRNT